MIICVVSTLTSINGITLWPVLLVRHKALLKDTVFMNHEHIHMVQQQETGIILFYLWYGIEYLVRRCFSSHDDAYRNIVFEREAYAMDSDLSYLKSRRFWAFLRFYRKTS